MPVCLAEALTLSVLERGSQSVHSFLNVSGRKMCENKMYWGIKKVFSLNIVYVQILPEEL